MTNMTIWNSVSKTDPAHTKKVTFGRKFTAIDAHYQIMKATQEFGPVGQGWGYNCEHSSLSVDNDTLFAICDVWVWWDNPKNMYGPIRGASELRYLSKRGSEQEKINIDTDAPKKAMTDALTKGLSHLGFSADVFLGLFDDNKYVQQRTAEEAGSNKAANDMAWASDVTAKMGQAESLNLLEEMWQKLEPHLKGRDKEAVNRIEKFYGELHTVILKKTNATKE